MYHVYTDSNTLRVLIKKMNTISPSVLTNPKPATNISIKLTGVKQRILTSKNEINNDLFKQVRVCNPKRGTQKTELRRKGDVL